MKAKQEELRKDMGENNEQREKAHKKNNSKT